MEMKHVRQIHLTMKEAQVIVHVSLEAGNFGGIDSISLLIEEDRSVKMVIIGIGLSEDPLNLDLIVKTLLLKTILSTW